MEVFQEYPTKLYFLLPIPITIGAFLIEWSKLRKCCLFSLKSISFDVIIS